MTSRKALLLFLLVSMSSSSLVAERPKAPMHVHFYVTAKKLYGRWGDVKTVQQKTTEAIAMQLRGVEPFRNWNVAPGIGSPRLQVEIGQLPDIHNLVVRVSVKTQVKQEVLRGGKRVTETATREWKLPDQDLRKLLDGKPFIMPDEKDAPQTLSKLIVAVLSRLHGDALLGEGLKLIPLATVPPRWKNMKTPDEVLVLPLARPDYNNLARSKFLIECGWERDQSETSVPIDVLAHGEDGDEPYEDYRALTAVGQLIVHAGMSYRLVDWKQRLPKVKPRGIYLHTYATNSTVQTLP